MLISVEQLGTNPIPEECPQMLSMFNKYYVCPEILAYRCKTLLRSFFENSLILDTWSEGKWFLSILDNTFLDPDDENSAPYSSNPFKSDSSFEGQREVSQLFLICRQLIDTLDTPGDNLESFLQDIMNTASDTIVRKFRQKTRTLFESFQVFIDQTSSEEAKRECLTRTLWVTFWRCYRLLQLCARLNADGQTMARSWRHIPALVTGIFREKYVSSLRNITNIVANNGGTKRKYAECDEKPLAYIRLTSESVPYALWLANQLENVNYYRVAAHNSLLISSKQDVDEQTCDNVTNNAINTTTTNTSKKSVNTSINNSSNRKFVSNDKQFNEFEKFLRAIRDSKFNNIVNIFFDAVLGGNILVQDYVYSHLSNLPRVLHVAAESFTIFINRRQTVLSAKGYSEFYEKFIEFQKLLLDLTAAFSEEQKNSLLLQSTLESDIDMKEAHGIAESNCNEQIVIKNLCKEINVVKIKMQSQQAAMLTTKMLLLLCRSWSQGYVQGNKFLQPFRLRAHTKIMRKKICRLSESIHVLCLRLVEHLCAVEHESRRITLPVAIAVSILSHIENDVKHVLSESVSLLLERTKLSKEIEILQSKSRHQTRVQSEKDILRQTLFR